MVVIDVVMLKRNDEYREILLCQDDSLYRVWEAIGKVPSGVGFDNRQQIGFGTESSMRKFMDERRQEFCNEGYSICKPDPDGYGSPV